MATNHTNVNDDSKFPVQDGNPEKDQTGRSVITDFDAPQILCSATKTTGVARHNFQQWVTITLLKGETNENKKVAGAERCSPRRRWADRMTISFVPSSGPGVPNSLSFAGGANENVLILDGQTNLSLDLNGPSYDPNTPLTPATGTRGGAITVVIKGGNFDPGATVSLFQPSTNTTIAGQPTHDSMSQISCIFDLTNATAGNDWILTVKNPDLTKVDKAFPINNP